MFPFNFSSLLLFPGSLIFCSPFCSLVFLLLFYLCSDLFSIPCFFYLLIFSFSILFFVLFHFSTPISSFSFLSILSSFPSFPSLLFTSLLISLFVFSSFLAFSSLLAYFHVFRFTFLFSSLFPSLVFSSLPFSSLSWDPLFNSITVNILFPFIWILPLLPSTLMCLTSGKEKRDENDTTANKLSLEQLLF